MICFCIFWKNTKAKKTLGFAMVINVDICIYASQIPVCKYTSVGSRECFIWMYQDTLPTVPYENKNNNMKRTSWTYILTKIQTALMRCVVPVIGLNPDISLISQFHFKILKFYNNSKSQTDSQICMWFLIKDYWNIL